MFLVPEICMVLSDKQLDTVYKPTFKLNLGDFQFAFEIEFRHNLLDVFFKYLTSCSIMGGIIFLGQLNLVQYEMIPQLS